MFSERDLLTRHWRFQSPSPTLVDVGANVGDFAAGFAGWQVVAFEPVPENAARLRERLPHATVIQKAVASLSQARVPFHLSSAHDQLHALTPFHDSHDRVIYVPSTRLDDALDLPYVTVLKIDVEGADFAALRSFDFDRYQPEAVVVEFMDGRSDFTHHDLVQYMRGYTAFVAAWRPKVDCGYPDFLYVEHEFVGCTRYPTRQAPAWGNLIFIPDARANAFAWALRRYLLRLRLRELKQRMTIIPSQYTP